MDSRLYRSRRNRIIGGVAGGMAESLGVDPTIVRIVWVILALTTPGIGILLYFVLLFVIPEAPASTDASLPVATGAPTPTPPSDAAPPPSWQWDPPATRDRRSSGLLLGIILVLVGAWFLLRQIVPFFDFDVGWPVIAIVVGIVLVAVSLGSTRRP